MKKTNKIDLPNLADVNICIIGLGYVGLPLAIEFSKIKKCLRTNQNLNRKVIGFDLNEKRVEELKAGIDSTGELNEEDRGRHGRRRDHQARQATQETRRA